MRFITPSNVNAILGLLLVCGYYFVLWFRARAHQSRSVVTLYQPPRDLSPAMLRFIWKERFDDRTFWAGVLSLVSKDLAAFEEKDGESYLHSTEALPRGPNLPEEESLLAESLFDHQRRQRVPLNITDARVAVAISRVSQHLHEAAIGKWFRSNYRDVLAGGALSVAAICLTAGPYSLDQWGTLLLPLAAMAPAGYYGFFLVLRMVDLLRAARACMSAAVIGRAANLLAFLVPCLAAFVLGAVLLGATFGVPVVILTACLVAVNVASLVWVRFPTLEGRRLLNEIEGFREYLLSVERLPEDRMEAPNDHAGVYERYLPYAVALEVEQSWCDKYVALKSTFHEQEVMPGVRPFYLGMWDGNAVEIVYKPSSGRGAS